ncbi:TatD DNase family protein [Caloranaerobacter azorensis DSM 13643]|uniref:TatD DNase family protein n=1 Tax=Caloranaerobacter azorensis DSM 13643 TaxID=1121264 RepID=A0A1M5T6C4_9FIRM|nr:TatD family hydrolase [Caloranaerobacter azorensis]SHH46150.1 TatD DNase family protein [Caloranaerobacter azorensis DSM 13643]
MLIDSHAHLDDKRFDKDRDKIIKNLKDNDVSIVINPGADLASSIKAVALAEEYENIYAAVGIHPHDAKTMDEDTIEVLKSLLKKDKVIAVGEIGLDYHYDFSPRDVQKKWFREQIKLAKEFNLPIIVHDREAHKDVYDILKEEQDGTLRGVLHCFSGSVEMAKEYIKMGFYISFAGPITFKNAKTPREVAKAIDINRILIETDSPYLTPHPHRGKRNEPLYVRYVAAMIAELKGMTIEEVAHITAENTKKLFNIN